ncbi:MAG: alpha/beta hydrolase [Gammaproteobacteria bacterium]|nr:alpha/beta hydrolase [Gammaproteobacteria bacterium]
MPFAEVNGQRLYYEDTGGDAPAVVFSHGLLMDHEMFAPQAERLRGRYRCITWDERGHGKTAGDSIAPFTYYDSADDLAALLVHLGVGRAVLAGMSQGGFLSLRCALTHPGVARALILIDTQSGREDPAKLPAYRQMMDVWAGQGLPDAIADTIEQIILGPNWDGAPAWKAKWRTWKPHNLMTCFETLAGRDDIGNRLGEIEAPALVIHGEADVAIPLARAQALAAGLPNAKLLTVPGAGHASNLTHPQDVNTAIERFLTGLPT